MDSNNHPPASPDVPPLDSLWWATLGPDRFRIDPTPLAEVANSPVEVEILRDHPTYDGQTTLEITRPDWNPPEPGLMVPVDSAGTHLGDWSGRPLSADEAAEVLGLPPERVQPLVARALELYRDTADREQRYDAAVQRMDPGELCRAAGASLCIYEPEFEPKAETHLPVARDSATDPTMAIFLTAPRFRDDHGNPLHLQQAANRLGLSNAKMLDLGYQAASMLRAGQAAFEHGPGRSAGIQTGALASSTSPATRSAPAASHRPGLAQTAPHASRAPSI